MSFRSAEWWAALFDRIKRRPWTGVLPAEEDQHMMPSIKPRFRWETDPLFDPIADINAMFSESLAPLAFQLHHERGTRRYSGPVVRPIDFGTYSVSMYRRTDCPIWATHEDDPIEIPWRTIRRSMWSSRDRGEWVLHGVWGSYMSRFRQHDWSRGQDWLFARSSHFDRMNHREER